MQASDDIEPVEFRYVPLGQSRHIAVPLLGLYFPRGHIKHSVLPGKLLYRPGAQGEYSELLFRGQALPEGHGVHLLDPVEEA